MSEQKKDDGLRSEFLSKRLTRREVLKGAAVLGVGAAMGPLISACGSSSSSSSSSSSAAIASSGPKTGGNLRVATSAGSTSEDLDAHAPAVTMPALQSRFNLYDSLLEFSSTGVLGMALAQEVTPNSTATQYTARLKPGLKFSSGQPVSAADVIYSFNRIMNPKNPGLAATQLLGLKPGGVKKLDNLTVRFDLDQANAVFPQALATYSAAIVPVGYSPKGAIGVIGTGPFTIKNFIPGQQMVFAKNPYYWRQGGGPYVDTVTVTEFADTTAQLNALLGGSADYVNMIQSSQKQIAQNAGAVLLNAKTGAWIPFTMRCDVKPFNDVRVRQAFRLIVGRPQLIEQAENGEAWVGNDMYAPYDPGYPTNLPQRVQDLAQAKSLLKAAGYDNNLVVPLTTSTAVSSNAPAEATVFAQQAKGAGVTVNINNVNGTVFWGPQYLKYVFAQDNWGTRDYLVQAAMGTVPGAVYNETHWNDPQLLALIGQAYKTVDDAKRNELISEAETLEYNEGGYILHSFSILTDAHSKKVMGAVPNYSGLGSAASNAEYRTMYFA